MGPTMDRARAGIATVSRWRRTRTATATTTHSAPTTTAATPAPCVMAHLVMACTVMAYIRRSTGNRCHACSEHPSARARTRVHACTHAHVQKLQPPGTTFCGDDYSNCNSLASSASACKTGQLSNGASIGIACCKYDVVQSGPPPSPPGDLSSASAKL